MFLYVVFFTLITYYFYQGTRKPDKYPPGPPKLPLVGSLPFIAKNGSFIHSIIYTVEKYGKVAGVYMGRQPVVFIADFNILKDLFKREELSSRPPFPPNNETRPGWQTVGQENNGRNPGVIATTGNYWREQRRFLLKNLKDFGFGKASMESIIQDEMSKLCLNLAQFPENEPVDLNRTMNISILNALWSILVGEKLDLDDPKLAAIIKMFDRLFRENSGPASPLIPILPHPSMAKLPGLRSLTGFDTAFATFKATQEFIEPYITEHKRTLDPDNIRDFVDLMLVEIQNTTDKDSSFYGETGYYALFNDLIDMFLAGMETTSSSLLWTFLFLLHHPDVQSKVHKELDEVVGRNRFPGLDDRPNLHYMNAVLLESLRVASLVGPGVPHYTTKEVTVGEYVIPKNTTVFGSLYHVMNDPEHFKNPHVFDPDRFLDANGKFLSEERVAPFGIGKRICLGQTLAEKEFYLFFAGILQQFELNQDETTTLPSYDMNQTFPKGLLRNAPQFNLKLRHRLKA